MDIFKKFFPYSFGAKNITALIIKIIVYIVAGAVIGVVFSFLSAIPLLNILISLLSGLINLYVICGIILAILDYCKIIK